MVIALEMSGNDWYSTGKNALAGGRVQFNDFLRGYIGARLSSFDDCDKVVIQMPAIVTKSDRYSIHKMTIPGEFMGTSYDFGEERMIELKLSKNFVRELMLAYQFRNDFIVNVEAEPVQRTEKQLLFDNLIGFIESNLQNEFHEFLKKI